MVRNSFTLKSYFIVEKDFMNLTKGNIAFPMKFFPLTFYFTFFWLLSFHFELPRKKENENWFPTENEKFKSRKGKSFFLSFFYCFISRTMRTEPKSFSYHLTLLLWFFSLSILSAKKQSFRWLKFKMQSRTHRSRHLTLTPPQVFFKNFLCFSSFFHEKLNVFNIPNAYIWF